MKTLFFSLAVLAAMLSQSGLTSYPHLMMIACGLLIAVFGLVWLDQYSKTL